MKWFASVTISRDTVTTSCGGLPCLTRALISSQVLFCVEIVWRSFWTSLMEDKQLSFKLLLWMSSPGLTRSGSSNALEEWSTGSPFTCNLYYPIDHCPTGSPEGDCIACTGTRGPFGLTWELLGLRLGTGLVSCSVGVFAQTQQGWPSGIRGPMRCAARFTWAHPSPPKDARSNARLNKVTWNIQNALGKLLIWTRNSASSLEWNTSHKGHMFGIWPPLSKRQLLWDVPKNL